MSPRVSILIPIHNAESTVRSSVESVLRQTYADFEIAAIDDGSIDHTGDILDSLKREDSRICVVHVPHGGIISALNTGIAVCKGEYIARMDADDLSHPKRLEMQVELLDSRPEISVCSTMIRMFPRKNLLGGLERYEEWLNSLLTPEQIARDMFVESPVAHPSIMMRKDELMGIGGYQEHGWAEDYDLWLRYSNAGKLFAKVPCSLVAWRQAEGRLTFTDSRYSVENFLRAKAHYLVQKLAGCGRSVVLWGAGKTGRRLIKHLIRGGMDIEAVVDIDPDKIGHTLRKKPIVGVDYLINRREVFVIAAVSSHGARQLIREKLREFGLVEIRDFICAA